MKRLAAALAVAAVVVAAAAMWWPRAPEESAPLSEAQRVRAHAEAPASTPPAAPTEAPAARKLAELRALSESVRNSTFVIAIRAAGLVCEDVIGVDQIELGAPAWRARCPDLRAYFLRVTDAGELAVEPALAHFDSVVPAIVAPPGNPPDLLQPRELQR